MVITGVDGSGKDYVAQHLHQIDQDSGLIGTPTPAFLSSRLAVDAFALEVPSAHYYFYLASVIHASCLIEDMLKRGNVYCVRYLIDTIVYHRAMGLPVQLEYETVWYKIKKPDMTIFLEIDDENLRQSRLKEREKITVGDQMVNQFELRSRILSEYAHFSREFITVNNSHRKIDDVITEIHARCAWL